MSAKREREGDPLDSETQLPPAKRQKRTIEEVEEEEKRKESILAKLTLKKIIHLFNERTRRRDVNTFFCADCKKLCIGESNDFVLLDGHEQFYCDDCTRECEGCGDLYCDDLEYKHDNCQEEEEYDMKT